MGGLFFLEAEVRESAKVIKRKQKSAEAIVAKKTTANEAT